MHKKNKRKLKYKSPRTSKKAILFAQLDFVLSPEILEISFIVTGEKKNCKDGKGNLISTL